MKTAPDLFLFLFLVALVRLPKLSYLPRGFACEQPGGTSLGLEELLFDDHLLSYLLSEHFLASNHSDNYMLLIPIEKLKNGRDSFRKAREDHLTHKAKTIEPLGINKRDEL